MPAKPVLTPDLDVLAVPDTKPVTDSTNLYCWKDSNRVCNADCMAYQTKLPSHSDYQGQQWAHCMLLVNGHRTSKHLVIIAETLSKRQGATPLPDPPITR